MSQWRHLLILAVSTTAVPCVSFAWAGDLFITQKPTNVYSLKGGELRPACNLPQRCCLRRRGGAAQLTLAGTSAPFVFVDVISKGPIRSGWICTSDALNLSSWADSVPQRVHGRIPPPPEPPSEQEREQMPALIAIQAEPIRAAWKEMEQAVAANMQLDAAERLPEPFMARAEIWAIAGNHREALKDTLNASKVLQARGTDLVDFAKYFGVLKKALDEHDREGEPRYLQGALDYWGSATTDFFQSRFEAALPGLTNAVQLDPRNPLFWYYRSLAYRGLGMDREAVHDARVGAALEHRWKTSNNLEYLRHLGARMERIQGPRRIWLERFRHGDPSVWTQRDED